MSGYIQITYPLAVPRVVFLQDDFFEPDMLLILEGFSSQHHHVILPQDEIAAGDEDTVVALYNGNDDTLGQMQLGDALVHPGIPGCEVDPDKVYVGLLSVFRHALDAGILVYKTCGYDTGRYGHHAHTKECNEDAE